MGGLRCDCGEDVKDSSSADMESNWGNIVSNGTWWSLMERQAQRLAKFYDAYAEGRGKQWIIDEGLGPYADRPLESIIYHLLDADVGVPYAVCRNCGRLWIRRRSGDGDFVTYMPTGEETSEEI